MNNKLFDLWFDTQNKILDDFKVIFKGDWPIIDKRKYNWNYKVINEDGGGGFLLKYDEGHVVEFELGEAMAYENWALVIAWDGMAGWVYYLLDSEKRDASLLKADSTALDKIMDKIRA